MYIARYARLLKGHVRVDARKLECDRPPSPNQRKKETPAYIILHSSLALQKDLPSWDPGALEDPGALQDPGDLKGPVFRHLHPNKGPLFGAYYNPQGPSTQSLRTLVPKPYP